MDDSRGFDNKDFDCTWLELFHPTGESTRKAKADIIFVPGLGGDYIETWKARDGTVWPKDLLPLRDNVPDIRILSFQYNTSIYGTTSQAGIRDHANDLLVWLFNDREDDEPASLRPLVFVGHSLGGVVIKSALTKMARDIKYQNLWDASRGVMFFATPHLGLSKEDWRQFAHRVLLRRAPSEGVLPTDSMLRDLRVNSSTLEKVAEDFQHLQPFLSFVTFIEKEAMAGMDEVIVNHVYGYTRSPTEFPHRLSGDHITLCQFRNHDHDSDEFGLVRQGIEDLINDTPRAVHRLTYQEKRALYSLCPASFHCHFLDRKPTEGTCKWLFDVPEVKDWLAHEPGKERLWIHGKTGCGKGFLARHVMAELTAGAASMEEHGVVHCFLSDSHPARGNLQVLLRVTLYQVLRLKPDLVPRFLLLPFEKAQDRDYEKQDIWTRDILLSIWVDAMAEVMARRPLTLVIDGLDEMGRDCQEAYFNCLEELLGKTKKAFKELDKDVAVSAAPQQRFLVISREVGDIAARLGQMGFRTFGIQPRDTEEDIKKTARAGLRYLRSSGVESQLEEICSKIADMSNGSYLWATLVVEELKRTRKTSGQQILSVLDQYPPGDVDRLYAHILLELSNKPKSGAFVRQVLQWALFQQEGLKLAEFKVALALAKATTRHPSQTITPEILASCLGDNIEARVAFHCGHLVKFQDGRLSLTHRTLKHYLSTQTSSNPDSEFSLDPETCHAHLANLCMAYLTMPAFSNAGPPHDVNMNVTTTTSWESKLRHRLKSHPFLRYAALYWYKHLALAGAAWPTPEIAVPGTSTSIQGFMYNPSPSSRADQLMTKSWLEKDGEGREYARCWTEVWWFLVKGVAEQDKGKGPLGYPEGFEKVSPARVAGLPRPIDVPLPDDEVEGGVVVGHEEEEKLGVVVDKENEGIEIEEGRSDEDGRGLHAKNTVRGKNKTKDKPSGEETTERIVYVDREVPVERVVYVDRPPVVVVEKEVKETVVTETVTHFVETERVVLVPEETIVVIPGEPEEIVVVVEVEKEPEGVPKERLSYFQKVRRAGKELIKAVMDIDATETPGTSTVANSKPVAVEPRPERQGGQHMRKSRKRRN